MTERSRDVLEQHRNPEVGNPLVFKVIRDLVSSWKGVEFADRLRWHQSGHGVELALEPLEKDEIPEEFKDSALLYRDTDSFARYFSYPELQELYALLASYGFVANRDDIDRSAIRLSTASAEGDKNVNLGDTPSEEIESIEQRERDPMVRRLIDTVLKEVSINYGDLSATDLERVEYLELARTVVHFMAESEEDPDELLGSLYELSLQHPQFAPFAQWFDARMQGPFFRLVKASYPVSASEDTRIFGAALRQIGTADAHLANRATSLHGLETFVATSREKSQDTWPDVALGESADLELTRQYAYNGEWNEIDLKDWVVSEDNARSVAIDVIIHAFGQDDPQLDVAQVLKTICECKNDKTRVLLCEIADLWYRSEQQSLRDMANAMLTNGLLEAETKADVDDNYSFWFVSMLRMAYGSQDTKEVENFHDTLLSIVKTEDPIAPYLWLFRTADLYTPDIRADRVKTMKDEILRDSGFYNHLDPWDIECWEARLGHGEAPPDRALYNRFRTALKQLLDAEIPSGNDDIRIWGLERIIAHMQAADVPQGIVLDVLGQYFVEDVLNKNYSDSSLQKILNLYVHAGFDKHALEAIDTLRDRVKINGAEYERFERQLLVHAQLCDRPLFDTLVTRHITFPPKDVSGNRTFFIRPILYLFLDTDFSIEDLKRLDSLWLTSDERFSSAEKEFIANELLYWCADNPLDSRIRAVLDLALQYYNFSLGENAPRVFVDIIQGLRLQQAFEKKGIL